MRIKIFQKGFNYSQDGQGNRLVYHLQGCNMRCPWCANPEGMIPEGVLFTDPEWLRESLCPIGAIKKDDTKKNGYVLHRERCASCKNRECLSPKYKGKGIRLSYEERSVDEIYDEIVRSSPLFYDGGGVTFTGGEATLQFDALKELLVRLKMAGIHTALETNGAHRRLPELFPYIDQLIMDCKHWNEEKHLMYTGVPMEMVKENLRMSAERHEQLDIRIPLIGGVNDSDEDMRGFIALFKSLFADSSQVTVEVLKYHEFGRNKWEACGWTYQMNEKAHVTLEQVKRFRELIIASGFLYKKS